MPDAAGGAGTSGAATDDIIGKIKDNANNQMKLAEASSEADLKKAQAKALSDSSADFKNQSMSTTRPS